MNWTAGDTLVAFVGLAILLGVLYGLHPDQVGKELDWYAERIRALWRTITGR